MSDECPTDPCDRSHLEVLACAIHEQLGDEVPWTFGKASASEHGEARRYHWNWGASPIVSSETAGPGPLEIEEEASMLGTSVWTIQETAHVSVYGESYGAIDRMVRNFIAATKVIPASIRFARVVWGIDQPEGTTQRNIVAVIIFSVPIPVVETVYKLRRVDGYATNLGTLQEDGTIKPID